MKSVAPKHILAFACFATVAIYFLAFRNSDGMLAPAIKPATMENVVVFETEAGKIVWRLFPKHAPITVSNFIKLVEEGHYNYSHFYRAEPNFCLQGGIWSLRNAPYGPIPLEYKLSNKIGFVSMARSKDPDSATTEFSIMMRDNSEWLAPGGSDKYGYAVFAQVIAGWDVIQKIMKFPTKKSGELVMLEPTVKIKCAYLDHQLVPTAFVEVNEQ